MAEFHARMLIVPCAALSLAASEGELSFDLRTEPSRVEIGSRRTTWWTSQAQLLYRDPARGGWFLSAERQQRGDSINDLGSAGAYLRKGDWTFSLQGAAGVDAVFVPKVAGEVYAGRRVAGGMHLGAGYQVLVFPATRVHLASAAAFYYFPEGELELRYRGGRNEGFDHAVQVWLCRWLLDRGGRWAFGGTVAAGNNLFDILAVPIEGGRGWTANANLRWRFHTDHSLRLDVGGGREQPGFRQRLLGIAWRSRF